jgi:hypothetical protein
MQRRNGELNVGPRVLRPSFSRAWPPVSWPNEVKKSIFSIRPRLLCLTVMKISPQELP